MRFVLKTTFLAAGEFFAAAFESGGEK